MAEQDFSKVVQQLQLANEKLARLERLQKEGGTAKGIIAASLPEVLNERSLSKRKEQFDTKTGITQTDDAVRDNTEAIANEVKDLKKTTEKTTKAVKQTAKVSLQSQVKKDLMQADLIQKGNTQAEKDAINQEVIRREELEKKREELKQKKDEARQAQSMFGKDERRQAREEKEQKELNQAITKLLIANPLLDSAKKKELEKDSKKIQADILSEGLSKIIAPFKATQNFLKNLGAKPTGIPGLNLGRLAMLVAIPMLIKFLNSPQFDEVIKIITGNGAVLDDLKFFFTQLYNGLAFLGGGILDILRFFSGFGEKTFTEQMIFLKDNFLEMLLAIGFLASGLNPFRLLKGVMYAGMALLLPTGKFGVLTLLKRAFIAIATVIGGLATSMFGLTTIGTGAATAAAAAGMAAYGGVAGASYRYGQSTYTLNRMGQFINTATGQAATPQMAGRLQSGIRSGSISQVSTPKGSRLARLRALVARHPALKAALFGATTLGVLEATGMSREQKIREVTGIITSMLGIAAMTKLGTIIGGMTGTAIAPGPGTLAGLLIGAGTGIVVGGGMYLLGRDFLGRKIAEFLVDGSGDNAQSIGALNQSLGEPGLLADGMSSSLSQTMVTGGGGDGAPSMDLVVSGGNQNLVTDLGGGIDASVTRAANQQISESIRNNATVRSITELLARRSAAQAIQSVVQDNSINSSNSFTNMIRHTTDVNPAVNHALGTGHLNFLKHGM